MSTSTPALASALRNHQAGRLSVAAALYQQVLATDPDNSDALHLLGKIAHQQGKNTEALDLIGRAIRLSPGFAVAHNDFGCVLEELERFAEAAESFCRAIEAAPDFAAAHANLSNALCQQNDPVGAESRARRAIELDPLAAEAHDALGLALRAQGRVEEAIASHRRALALRPAFADGLSNLGAALQELGLLDEAAACHRRALTLQPHNAGLHYNYGRVLEDLGRPDQAATSYARAVDLRPNFVAAHSHLLMCEQYRRNVTPDGLLERHKLWDARHGTGLVAGRPGFANDPDPNRRLRIGFVCADFGRQAVGSFTIRLLEGLDRRQAETFCYAERTGEDDLTGRFRAAAGHWRDTARLSAEALAMQIRSDRIDLLFDLTGHGRGSRLTVFACRVAPIQAAWAGYPGTTGLGAMDFLIADRFEVPEGAERLYRETVLRLPDGYVCYDPPAAAAPVGPLPALRAGHITFGSFNMPLMIGPAVVARWARILRRVPTARLVLLHPGFDRMALRARLTEEFAGRGVEPARLELVGRVPDAERLARHGGIDLALDPFPCSGGLSTCEALWMGVPVITLPGATFAGRQALSHLSVIGLTELVARDVTAYVKLAVTLAEDPARLAALRAGLRERVAASPLCDGPGFARGFLAACRTVWRRWCSHRGSARIAAARRPAGPGTPGSSAADMPGTGDPAPPD